MTLNEPLFLAAVSGGLLGGFGHCIGMCGPIVSAVSLKSSREGTAAGMASVAFYNVGRVLTYSALGAAMGAAGSFVNVTGRLAHIQNMALYVSGAVMVLMGLDIAGLLRLSGRLEIQGRWITRLAGRWGHPRTALAFLPLGLWLGLLPCGLSYTFMIAAAGTADALRGGLVMFLFGLGTVPAMTSAGALALLVGTSLRNRLYRMGGVLVVLSGLYLIARGILFHANL